MVQITVDPGVELPAVRPLHGVNNGPIGYGSLVDVSHLYRAAGFPLVRLHDPNWPHPREVDIPQVFPDFDADPEDPASYRFAQTDDYIQRIIRTGAKVVYRLGVSIEHTPRKYFTAPPRDFAKWARVCQGIVRHYNRGWAEGFELGIPYWEIWNEADLDERMWGGSYEQYLELYRHAAVAVKAADPAAKVGGPAVTYCRNGRLEQFVQFCRDHALPLDFASWHGYRKRPADFAEEGRFVRGLLDQYGFARAESHLNEWNYVDFDWNSVYLMGNEVMRREAFERQKNQFGASFAAASLILMQDAGIDAACYYDGQPSAMFCGLFDYYGVPQKTYYAFQAFSEMVGYGRRISVRVEGAPVAMACRNDAGEVQLLVSNFSETACACEIAISGASAAEGRVRWIDSIRTLTEERLGGPLLMPGYSVAMATIRR